MGVEINIQTKSDPISETEKRLEDIRSMMDAGHKSIRLEKHTLIYWGVTGGLLCAIMPFVYEGFTDYWTTIAVFMATTITALATVAIVDYRKTGKIRCHQHESISFVQKQITRIWWMLIATAILLSFGMAIYGGSYLEISMWIFIVGLGLIIHGLFSSQPLNRFGFILMTLAIFSAFFLPYNGTRWLAASLFGIGMPLVALLLYRGSGFLKGAGFAQLLVWLICISVSAYAAYSIETALRSSPPEQTAISLAAYNQQADQQGTYVVTIPAGSNIPFKFSISGSPVKEVHEHVIPLSLQQAIDIVLVDGQMTGMYRLQGESWQSTRWDYPFRINRVRIKLDKQNGLHALMDMKVLLGKGSDD